MVEKQYAVTVETNAISVGPDDSEQQLELYMRLDEAGRAEELLFPVNQKISFKLLNSQAMRIVFDFLDQNQIIGIQILNRFMYRKMMHLHPIVIGDRIENCIMVYSDYGDQPGAISVIVGKPDLILDSELRVSRLVADF